METSKHTISVPSSALPAMRGVEAKVAKVAKRLGVEAPSFVVTETFMRRDDLTFKWIEMSKVEFTNTNLSLGDYEFLARVDHVDGVVTAAPGSPEGTIARLSNLDPTCDHCGTARKRNSTFVVVGADGEEKRVGRNCLRDFLGHQDLDVAALNAFWASLSEWDDEEMWYSMAGKSIRPVMEILAAACAVTGSHGYVPASAEFGVSTRDVVIGMLTTKPERRQSDEFPAVTILHVERAQEVLAWVKQNPETGDFALRMKQIAAVEGDAMKYVGMIAFMPEAYRRHLDREAEKVAAEKVEVSSAPCPLGKIVLAGEVVGVSIKDTGFGSVKKLIVRDDRGFKVYVTEPSSICADRGDRVSMSVTVEGVSDKDPAFGFGKRPSKATVLAAAEQEG